MSCTPQELEHYIQAYWPEATVRLADEEPWASRGWYRVHLMQHDTDVGPHEFEAFSAGGLARAIVPHHVGRRLPFLPPRKVRGRWVRTATDYARYRGFMHHAHSIKRARDAMCVDRSAARSHSAGLNYALAPLRKRPGGAVGQ